MDSVKVGLLGFGTIGGGVADILINKADQIAAATGKRIELVKICDKDLTSDRGVAVPDGVLTDDLSQIMDNPEISIVVELIGGTVDLAVSQAGFLAAQYDTDVDKRQYLTDGMEIHLKPRKDGFVSEGKTAFYFSGGEIQKGGIVGSETDGFYYADDKGQIDLGYCDGVNSGGADWNVIEGKATKVESDTDKTLNLALKAVASCTDSKMTREEKLRKCFDYIKTSYLEGVRHDPPYTEMDWPIVYANDIYVYGKGDCYSYGAAYAYMGKAIGYTEVYACNSGGHGWAEIEGKYYDPEWDIHHNEYNHFGVAPEDPCDVNYSGTLVMGNSWMRIKI